MAYAIAGADRGGKCAKMCAQAYRHTATPATKSASVRKSRVALDTGTAMLRVVAASVRTRRFADRTAAFAAKRGAIFDRHRMEPMR